MKSGKKISSILTINIPTNQQKKLFEFVKVGYWQKVATFDLFIIKVYVQEYQNGFKFSGGQIRPNFS